MNQVRNEFIIFVFAALVALATGCSTTKQQTENMLSTAGFKPTLATTPEQKAHLKSLPSGKITSVQRNGLTYFVYPDAGKKALYIGQQQQYEEFKKLQMQNLQRQSQMLEEQERATGLQRISDGSQWGAWDGVMAPPGTRP